MNSYRTIDAVSQGLYKEKGSKFISFAYPVTEESQVKQIMDSLKKEYYDARHHCYAYRMEYDGSKTRAVDDSEPSSTAGKPILGQILSHELTNVLVVVIRYFGGTKLGVSGLIQAYKEAACSAIENGNIVVKEIVSLYELTFGYVELNSVMKVVKDYHIDILAQDFDNCCTVKISLKKEFEELSLSKLNDISGLFVKSIGQ